MPAIQTIQPYLSLASDLSNGRISRNDLRTSIFQLPPLDRKLLEDLAEEADRLALTAPRHGWAVAYVADRAAASQRCDLFLRSLAAWYLGRAANQWVQPKRAWTVIARARRGFSKLKEAGWVAACDWQFYELSWTRSDLPQGLIILKQALDQLEHSEIQEFAPHCRLALADAQIQIGDFEAGRQNIKLSEANFLAQNDLLNQARCWRMEAGRARRQAQLDEAKVQLDNALRVFEEQGAFVDIAKVEYSFAMLQLFRTDDLSLAVKHFEQAIEMFSNCDLKLWRAASVNNLGATYLQAGELMKADACFREAMRYYARHGILAFLASTLEDSGKLNLAKGLPEASIMQYQKAGEIYEKLGLKLGSALLAANLGQAYGQLGRYQDALHHLERGMEQLSRLKNSLHLGTAEKYAALIWAQIGRPTLAHELLEKAAAHYSESKQKALLASLYNTRANIFFKAGDPANGIIWLERSLEVAIKHGIKPQIGLAHRLLGEAFIAAGQLENAHKELELALSEFSDIGMSTEQAATFVALGNYYFRTAQLAEAKDAFQRSLQLSGKTAPETDWRAYAGLAEIAVNQNDIDTALNAYHQAVETLGKIRYNFWQPALASSYLQTPSFMLDKAVSLAVEHEAHQESLEFIEAGKASTILRQLGTSNLLASDSRSEHIRELKAEIEWRQAQLRASFDAPSRIKSAIQTRELRTQLIEKIKQYDESVARVERQRQIDRGWAPMLDHFELDVFRELADQNLGTSWIALDYYKVKDQLVIAIVTTDKCLVTNTKMAERAEMALDTLARIGQSAVAPLASDLRVLGDLLIPELVKNLLAPQTYLLVAPHENLHGIPWAALQPNWLSGPLVGACIPSVVPSLHSLSLLWQRCSTRQAMRSEDVLLIGVSEFHGRYNDLPMVKDEIHKLSEKLGTRGHIITERDATLVNLLKLKNMQADSGLARFDWMHIASHFFPDPHTGRLSGIALWDGDIWLDQLRDLAPLPELVTFSACNSVFSFVYEGDEHADIPTTCFIAGANSVVGSSRRILDESASSFTTAFYKNYLAGMRPARAVAQAQRQMNNQGERFESWANFVCMGVP